MQSHGLDMKVYNRTYMQKRSQLLPDAAATARTSNCENQGIAHSGDLLSWCVTFQLMQAAAAVASAAGPVRPLCQAAAPHLATAAAAKPGMRNVWFSP